ncbi:uncharacterized protein VICG_01351 [Vittaforma corneae ATCC 50505]|uniref:Uncharacterized protein n=1 Tax=Vittaforma corneae (strain ATCC 50505) TaxID=993615 RepID=L2GL65_VITCO|nr:uncharacterized protein VICG_01351 [Vittaforma corneae ATCC 50505]ELA41603.1 hypothetical protein VICG_01351 [Vittaforma corneae ATCC 50505]
MCLSLLFLLASASKLEKCIFDDCNIQKALEMDIEEPIDYALKYFILKRFKKDTEKAVLTLLDAPEDNLYCNMILVRSGDIDNHLEIPLSSKNHILKELGASVADLFFKNKYNFRDLIVLEKAIPPREINDVIKNVWTCDPWVVSKFFIFIETRDIKLENVVNEVMYLAKKGDKQANYLMGVMHLHGIGIEKDLDKALEYFWFSESEEAPQSYIGVARVYMDEERLNEPNAINNLRIALRNSPNSEASYCLHLLTEASSQKEQKGLEYLKAAAYSGYLPAVYKFGVYLSKNNTLEASNTSLNSVMVFHPEILRYDTLAYGCFLEGNYRKALLIYMFLSEFNLPSAVSNTIYLLEKHRLIEDQDIIMCDIFKELAKTDPKYNKNIGDCYLHGNGVKKSYISAFASYLSSRKFSEEGAYNTAVMYEHGLGVPRNLYEAKRIISKYLYHESSYLVKFYSLLRINLKILLYHHYIISTLGILTAVSFSSLFFVKGA